MKKSLAEKHEIRYLRSLKRQIKKDLIKKYGAFCYYCESPFPEEKLTLDHVVPVFKMLPFKLRKSTLERLRTYQEIENLILACNSCNVRKGHSGVSREVFRRRTLKQEKGIVFKDEVYKGISNIVYPPSPI